jgi:hypothetical protein
MLAPVLVVAWRVHLHNLQLQRPELPYDLGPMVVPVVFLLACGALASAVSIVFYIGSLVEDGRMTVWRCLELAMLALPALPFLLVLGLFAVG